MSFKIDPTLEAESVPVVAWPLCDVRLSRNSAFPWVILVPRIAGKKAVTELDSTQQATFRRELETATKLMKKIYRPDRTDIVPNEEGTMLHINVIARHEDDPAWPEHVAGSGIKGSYTAMTLELEIDQLKADFAPAFAA